MITDRLTLLAIAAASLLLLPACQQQKTPTVNLSFASGAIATPGNPTAGQYVTVTFAVYDSDSSGATLTNVPWRIARDGVDGFAAGSISSLGANSTSALQSFSVLEATGTTHTYLIMIDPDNVIKESNENDNTQQLTLSWGVTTPPPGVNLYFAQPPAASPANPTGGTTFNLTFSVGDASGDGTGVTNVDWTVARDGVPNFTTGTIPAIGANSSVGVSIPLTEPSGSHTYQVTLDPSNTIIETNEGDNVQSVTVPVSLTGNG
jgi:subtilase family serine protease